MPSPEMDAIATAFAGPFPLDPTAGRAAYDALGVANAPNPETRWEPADLGGIGGPLSEWQWWDGVGDERVVLYLHGGGYVIGSPPTWRCFAGPLFADLSGLSPVQVEVSGRDGIRDDALRLATALRDAGVEVSIDDCEGAIHGYHMFAPETPEAQAGTSRLAAFLNAHLAPTPSAP